MTKQPVTVPSDDSDKSRTLNIDNLRAVTCTDVQRAGANDGGGDGGGGGGGDGGGGDNPVGVAQENTTADTTTSDLNTASRDTTAADANLNADLNRPNSGSFRCELFLRSVSDEQGALRDQYRGNEAIVQRFEQCLSEDVLANTIPDRTLPFTGGMPLLLLAAIGLAAIVAGVSVLRAVTRRGR